jgi:hypothetical protein
VGRAALGPPYGLIVSALGEVQAHVPGSSNDHFDIEIDHPIQYNRCIAFKWILSAGNGSSKRSGRRMGDWRRVWQK